MIQSVSRFRPGSLVLLAMTLVAVLPSPAAAYIDPGAGSLLLQIILGSLATVGLLFRHHWRRLLRFLRRPPDPEKHSPPDDPRG